MTSHSYTAKNAGESGVQGSGDEEDHENSSPAPSLAATGSEES